MISQDPSVLHVIISVFSAVFGLDAITECKNNNIDVAACLQLQNKRELIYRGIRSVDNVSVKYFFSTFIRLSWSKN